MDFHTATKKDVCKKSAAETSVTDAFEASMMTEGNGGARMVAATAATIRKAVIVLLLRLVLVRLM